MARYEDYVKDDLDSEIADAQKNAEERQEADEKGFEMPERFKGKSAEEIAKSYEELEKMNSRQAQDLGTMRKSIDELIALQSQNSEPEPVEPVDINDLYDDPEKTISRVAEQAVGSRVEALEKSLAESRVAERMARFDSDHQGWRDTVATPEFADWVASSPHRQRLAQAADQYDFDAAEDLFGLYNDHLSTKQKVVEEAQRQQQLADATLESSSPGVIDTPDTFSRTDLANARIAAHRGDQAARDWLNAHAEAIAVAYEEGNIID